MYSCLVNNSYNEVDIQKGFSTGISGTMEHTVKHTETLTHMTNHARRYQRNLVITLVDLKYPLGESDNFSYSLA